MATIPKKVAERFVRELGKFQKILQAARDRDVNESDTVVIVTDILTHVFGFDKYNDITSEYAVRSTYCDLAIRLGAEVKLLIEVKAIGLGLKDAHLRQAAHYGMDKGIDWVVLTNGIHWEIYKILFFKKPVDLERVCALDLLAVNPRKEEDQQKLLLLSREGLSRESIEDLYQRRQAINRFNIAALLLSEPCLCALRRELKRVAPGVKLDNKEIEQTLRTEVLKREVIDCEDAVQARALVKKAMGKALRATPAANEQREVCEISSDDCIEGSGVSESERVEP